MKAIKELGQHFLTDVSIAGAIADLAEIRAGEQVWEIGPGTGILTSALITRGAHVTAFELDRRMASVLEERFDNNFRLVLQDILKVNWATELGQHDAPIKLVANIPYQITSPLLYKLEEFHSHFSCVVMMLQKEVAERLGASPGSKSYGPMTLRLGLHFDISTLIQVGKESFDPVPKVDSAVIRMRPRQCPAVINNAQVYHKVITAAFAHRRKTLRNNLIAVVGKAQIDALEAASGIAFSRRAETLHETDFIRISDLVAAL
jgi:16S rRNA (adenine1518-N6/adenine1519-N6)-dimethyltransferase